IETQRIAPDVGVVRRRIHGDVAPLAEGVRGAVAARAGAPETVSAARPIAKGARLKAHDIRVAVAVHVGELDALVVERHAGSAPWEAHRARRGSKSGGRDPCPRRSAEQTVSAWIAAQREVRLEARSGAPHDVDETVEVDVEDFQVRCVAAKV